MIHVKFIGVGRGKLTWEGLVSALEHGPLLRQIRMRRALGSREVWFRLNAEETEGKIYVGLGRPVGRFEVLGGNRREQPDGTGERDPARSGTAADPG